jgi:hypothetical protein
MAFRIRRERLPLAIGALLVVAGARLAALDGRVVELRVVATEVRAAIELHEAFSSDMRRVLERDGTLHLRIEGALWEDRFWDRTVEPARITVYRIVREPSGAALAVIDAGGGVVTYPPYPDPLTVHLDLAAREALALEAKYYFKGIVTLGTLSDDELREAQEVVFGEQTGGPGLRQVGRFLLSTVLQISDYVRSNSARVRSSTVTGADLQRR